MSGYYQHYLTTGGVCYNPDPADDPTTEHQHKPNRDPANRLPTCGNDQTMNLNPLLFQNIIASQYFKALYEKKTFHEVVDEIYEHVDNLEPFLKGTTASTAFCLLYKLWTLKLSVKQVKNLITHLDSPHIRALGFLYLRYVLKPELLYEWFEGHLEDSEEIQVTKGPRPVIVTMGKLLRDLLMEQKFLGTMLPRIPVPIEREMRKKLAEDHGIDDSRGSSSVRQAAESDGRYEDREYPRPTGGARRYVQRGPGSQRWRGSEGVGGNRKRERSAERGWVGRRRSERERDRGREWGGDRGRERDRDMSPPRKRRDRRFD